MSQVFGRRRWRCAKNDGRRNHRVGTSLNSIVYELALHVYVAGEQKDLLARTKCISAKPLGCMDPMNTDTSISVKVWGSSFTFSPKIIGKLINFSNLYMTRLIENDTFFIQGFFTLDPTPHEVSVILSGYQQLTHNLYCMF